MHSRPPIRFDERESAILWSVRRRDRLVLEFRNSLGRLQTLGVVYRPNSSDCPLTTQGV